MQCSLGSVPSSDTVSSGYARAVAACGVLLLGAVVVASLLTGCSPKASGGALRIAVVPKGTTHEFWKMVHAGVIKAEREINAAGGPAIEAIWKGPQKEDDRAQQIQVVDNFISLEVAGMCLAPLDDAALLRPVQDAMKAKIPVVVFDSGLQGTVGEDYLAYVATDNYHGGVLGARRLGELLGGKGNVILLRYQEGSESTMQREKGFVDTLAKEFADIQLISSDLYAGATAESAYQKAQNLLTRLAAETNGIFCPNESVTFGMLRALEDHGAAGKIQFVGFDASETLVQAIRDGKIHGLVLQNPIKMGYTALKTVYAAIQGTPFETRIDTGVTVVTKANMDEPDMKLLHSPDLSPWLGE